MPTVQPTTSDLAVSVVMPCYNGAAFLAEALESVGRQTRRPGEVLVVDDGSVDDSREIALRLGARVLTTSGKRGPSHARNLGIQAAEGNVIAFLDADDYWDPTHCEELLVLLERHPDAVVAFSRAMAFGAATRQIGSALPDSRPRDVFGDLFARNMVVQSGVAARRDALLAVGGYREELRYAEDLDLWFRLARRGPFVASNRFTVHYRLHPAQAITDTAQLATDVWQVRARVWQEAQSTETPERLRSFAEVLRVGWNGHLRTAWRERDPTTFRTVLGLRDLIPDSEEIHRRWTWRARLFRRPWQVAAALWDRLPARARAALGSLKSAIRFQ